MPSSPSGVVQSWLATNPRYLASKGRPVPWMVQFCRYAISGRTVTAIARNWLDGDSGPKGTCRRCPRCMAEFDRCLLIVPVRLGADQVADFAPVDHAMRHHEF